MEQLVCDVARTRGDMSNVGPLRVGGAVRMAVAATTPPPGGRATDGDGQLSAISTIRCIAAKTMAIMSIAARGRRHRCVVDRRHLDIVDVHHASLYRNFLVHDGTAFCLLRKSCCTWIKSFELVVMRKK